MNKYKEFLKHLGINPRLMVADMRSRLPDSKKPIFVSRCKEFEKEAEEYYNRQYDAWLEGEERAERIIRSNNWESEVKNEKI